ncbi:hypothetical protein Agub_g11825, partial [Astrephomene gubernaculifera]
MQQLGTSPKAAPAPTVTCSRNRLLNCVPLRASNVSRTDAAPQQQEERRRQEHQAPAVILDDARTQNFMNWARGPASIRFSGVKPSTFAGIRGLLASKDISNDDLIVEVPRRSALVLAPKQRNSCQGLVTDEWWKSAPWFAKLAAMILWHKRQGAQSPLAPWIAQLPSSTGVPVLWSDSQLQALQYPPLIAQVQEQRREWQQLYDTFLTSATTATTAANQQPKPKPTSSPTSSSPPPSSPPSREEFFWAMSVVRSRTFSGPYIGSSLPDRLRLLGLVGALMACNTALGLADLPHSLSAALAVVLFNVLYEVILSRSLKQHAICPLIDLFNHSSAVQSEVSYNYFGDSYCVVASRDVKQGEQVFISYGPQSNDSLLQYYGFSEPANQHDTHILTDML